MLSILKSSNLNCQIRLKAPLENNFQIRIIAQNNLAALDIFPLIIILLQIWVILKKRKLQN